METLEFPQIKFKIHVTVDNKIVILNTLKNKFLVIEKSSLYVNQNLIDIQQMIFLSISNAYGILGIIKIHDVEVLVYVTSAVIIGTFILINIIRIDEINFLVISENKILSSEVSSTLEGIKKYISGNFYYSENNQLDLTRTMQKIYNKEEGKHKNLYSITYFWNYNMIKPLFNIGNDRENTVDILEWTLICICGYISIKNVKGINNSSLIKMMIISRRNKYYAGTRYNTRGIDSEGNVANFIETEQIIFNNENLFSYVQIRGSAPIIFNQNPAIMFRSVNICDDIEISQKPFLMHLYRIHQDYSNVYYINLLSENKFESELTRSIETHFEKLNPENCKYIHFNFHKECKHDNFSKISSFIESQENNIDKGKFFQYNLIKNEIICVQKHIFRTNCLDCLDRTNVIQYRIGWRILQIQVSLNIYLDARPM